MANELRQRKSAKRKAKAGKENLKADAPKTKEKAASVKLEQPNDEETLWQTFSTHPFVLVGAVIAIPYIVYLAFYHYLLKRPDLIENATLGLMSLRPAVRLEDERQMLIVGSLGSGTQQVASGLSMILQLEVAHEAVDAESYFTRDGSISNFLGIRFLPRPEGEDFIKSLEAVAKATCIRTKDSPESFHPKFYKALDCSSRFQKWGACETKECLLFIEQEWGCGLVEGGCATPFTYIFHQVQYPIRAIRELMAKACPGQSKTVHPGFYQLASPFVSTESDSCLATIGWYIVNYNNAMLDAQDKGLVDWTFRYEDISLCEIAQEARFLDPDRAIYKRTVPHLNPICVTSDEDVDARKKLPELATQQDELRSLPEISWTDFREAGGKELEDALKNLSKTLGYDPAQTPDVVERVEAPVKPKREKRPLKLTTGEVY